MPKASSSTTVSKNNSQKKANLSKKRAREQTENEIVDVTTPVPSDTEDNIQQNKRARQNDENFDSEVEGEMEIDTSKKSSWVWNFYRQVQRPNGDVATICTVETAIGVQCGKSYITKSSTGNLIDHLLKHEITKNNQHPKKVFV
jgi:hypothetical protein